MKISGSFPGQFKIKTKINNMDKVYSVAYLLKKCLLDTRKKNLDYLIYTKVSIIGLKEVFFQMVKVKRGEMTQTTTTGLRLGVYFVQ